MKPYEEAKRMYKSAKDFHEVLDFCGKHGRIYSDDDGFIAGYPTHSSLLEKDHKESVDKPDSWYIYIAAGRLRHFIDKCDGLTYLIYERLNDGVPRIVEIERLKRLLK